MSDQQLALQMQSNLSNLRQAGKIEQAIQHLDRAAQLFNKIGMTAESWHITKVIDSLRKL